MRITNQKHVGKFGALAGESSPSLPQLSRVISIPLTVHRDGPNPKTEYLKRSLGNFRVQRRKTMKQSALRFESSRLIFLFEELDCRF